MQLTCFAELSAAEGQLYRRSLLLSNCVSILFPEIKQVKLLSFIAGEHASKARQSSREASKMAPILHSRGCNRAIIEL